MKEIFNLNIVTIALKRFFKAFILSFIPVYVTILQQENNILSTSINTAIVSGMIGGLMALEKYIKELNK